MARETTNSSQRWDHQYQEILREVLEKGEAVAAGATKSTGSGKRTRDFRNHLFVLRDPRDRILWNPIRSLNVYGAIARFAWLLSGNDRLKDIAFYEPKVLGFSDDQMTVPGSDYGKRLFMPEPGLDQVDAIIKRLKEDRGTRRAVASIYRPEDAVRDSTDIPCAFGIAFHVRDGLLHMTTIMRSNAAWTLLPYNVFEFTLLGELVSVLAGIELGTYSHFALSQHLYEAEFTKAEAASTTEVRQLPVPMPPMPSTTRDELVKLAKWEADLRYAAKSLNVTNYRELMDRCLADFQEYWANFGLALLTYALLLNKRSSLAREVLAKVGEPLRQALERSDLRLPDEPSLEEDPVLLQSRISLLEYEQRAEIGVLRREMLWAIYQGEFQQAAAQTEPIERRRQKPLNVDGWERMDRASRESETGRGLFEK